MTDSLNPETLRVLRESNKFSQEGLAAAAEPHGRISKRQIARWEAGEVHNIRQHSKDVLCKTLGVKWEELTRPPKKLPERPSGTSELKLNVRPETLTKLELASRIYRVGWEEIVELAPLLFVLTAQASLQRRRQALDEAVSGVEKALNNALDLVPYIRDAFSWPNGDDMVEEEAAIKDRRVFDTYEDGEERRSHYADYLETLLDGLPKEVIEGIPGKLIDDIWVWGYPTAPSYRFSAALLERAVRKSVPEIGDLVESGEHLGALVSRVAAGEPDLRTLAKNRRTMPDAQFWDWIDPFLKPIDLEELF